MADLYNDFFWAQQSCFTYRNFKKIGDFSLRFSCPLCGDSDKDKKKARGNVYKSHKGILKYKCFNCGFGPVHISKFLQETDPATYQQYIMDTFSSKSKRSKEEINFKVNNKLPINKKVNLEKAVNVPDALDYLKSRKIPEKHYDKFYYSENYAKFVKEEHNQRFDYSPKTDPRIVLKCETEETLIGLIGRSLNPKNSLRYMNAKLDKEYENLVFGLLDLDLQQTIYAIEGAFDSLFVDNSISINSSSLTSISNLVPKENLVLIWDNEPRNREICLLIQKAIKNNYKVVVWPKNIKEKDINDMILSGLSLKELKIIIDQRTYSGLQAELMFNDWCKII